MARQIADSGKTYQNPVCRRSFPDPFVLKFRGVYYAYCTGISADGRVFGVMRSPDLIEWHPLNGAMDPLPVAHPHYWAPEITYYNGTFYLYYSVGNETLMELRVAVSDRPEGPFRDAGKTLTSQEFAIDAHVFRDDDRQWHMFYATDFLEHTHIGTGIVIDRMLDPLTLEGNPRPVTRARYDWQIYDLQRKEKGGVRWHTVEGPFVLKRKGVYYEMFSGGNWQNTSYGVSFAVTNDLDDGGEWHQHSDGTTTLPILRTIPGVVIGPGHNSVVRGPNNRELYCVYHRWSDEGRVLAIDRMDFAGGNRIFVNGPTSTPQCAPYEPQIFDSPEDDRSCFTTGESFLAEMTVTPAKSSGISLSSGEQELFSFSLEHDGEGPSAIWNDAHETVKAALPDNFDFGVDHELRVEADHREITLSLDDVELKIFAVMALPATELILNGPHHAFALTRGFEDRFENAQLGRRGWTGDLDSGAVTVRDTRLHITSETEEKVSLAKSVFAEDFELAVNLRVENALSGSSTLVLSCGIDFNLCYSDVWDLEIAGESVPLPAEYSFDEFRQLRFLCRAGSVIVFAEEVRLAEAPCKGADRIEIAVRDVTVIFDMIRFTVI